MFRLSCIAASAALLLASESYAASQLQQQLQTAQQAAQHENTSVQPSSDPSAATQDDADPALPDDQSAPPPKAENLTEESRLLIIRYVSGEFARVVSPLPGGKNGFHVKAGAPIDQNDLRRALTSNGAALNVGDNVQITKVDFHGHEIVLDLNGGPKGHTSWRDHIQLSAGGVSPVQTSTTANSGGYGDGPVVVQKGGATLYLDFGRSVPDMTPDEVKQYLESVLDFSKQRSAAVQWADSLPPEVRQAIADKRAEVGMDHDQVIAALGRPERKVRERDPDGNDIEDWIYGRPPQQTTFVRFEGDKVVRVSQYP
jgi:hypothetical protein